MIFNGIEKDYIRVTREFFRPPTPPIEFQTRPNAKGGARTKRKRFTDLILPVPIVVRSKTTIEDLKEDLSNWLVHTEPKKLIFKDKPNRHYLAEYESMELDEKVNYAKGVINFYLAEGYRFGPEQALNLTLTTKTFTIGGQESTVWESYTRFTVPQSSYTLESNVGKIILKYDFIAGDVLEIDYRTRDVFLNGKDLAVSVQLETVWFELPVGSVQLKASHATELKYSERFY
ncbi:distal tail protein Dit [Bacillus sp. FSL K6-3431]|uniref:distal tail protein Dit n=1 Tax=Bacillus sp. FSL K6-3431 TaxID=2921500 RepID=UPI0030FAE746